MCDLSVIICAHNPRPDHLAQVCESLQRQTLPRDRWEFLLIDNASKEPLADRWDLKWHPSARHIREDEPGLTPARIRGIREAKSDVIVFVDDDNVLADCYLERALRIAELYPNIGAWGGGIAPEYETSPGPEIADLLIALTIREVNEARWSNYDWSTCPYGAGICVRRAVALQYASTVTNSPLRRGLGRREDVLLGGEDIDMAATAWRLNLATGVFPSLQLTHLIPAARLERQFLYRLLVGYSYSTFMVQYFHTGRTVGLPAGRSFKGQIRDLLRQTRNLFYRPQSDYQRACNEAIRKAQRDIALLRKDDAAPSGAEPLGSVD